MTIATLTTSENETRRATVRRMMLPMTTGMALAGCINVKAPDKPIEINLNINVRQEVVVRLQQDVKDLVDKNPGVF